MRRRSSLALLVVLVALAGCSFLGGSPSTSTTETATFAGNVSAIEFPNGTNQNVILDAQDLVNSHVRSLVDAGYAVRVRENVSIRGSRVNRRRTVTSALDSDRLLLTIDVPGSEEGGARYLDNRTLYSRTTLNGSTHYDINTTRVPFEVFHARQTLSQPLVLLLEFGRYEAVGTVTRSGRTLIEYRLAAPSLNSRRVSNVTIQSADGRVLVGQNGIVHFASVDIVGQESGRPLFVDIEYEVTARGNVSVTPPGWLDRARNATADTTRHSPNGAPGTADSHTAGDTVVEYTDGQNG